MCIDQFSGRIAKLSNGNGPGLSTLQRELLRFVIIIISMAVSLSALVIILWAAWLNRLHHGFITNATLVIDVVSGAYLVAVAPCHLQRLKANQPIQCAWHSFPKVCLHALPSRWRLSLEPLLVEKSFARLWLPSKLWVLPTLFVRIRLEVSDENSWPLNRRPRIRYGLHQPLRRTR
jgi:hypothetical protein